MGNSTHSANPSQGTGQYLTQENSMKCAGFLVSTYSKLCHVIWCPTICSAAWVSNYPRATVIPICRRPFVWKTSLQTASHRWAAYEEAGKSSYADCIALTSKVQRKTVGRTPRSSVINHFHIIPSVRALERLYTLAPGPCAWTNMKPYKNLNLKTIWGGFDAPKTVTLVTDMSDILYNA